MTLDRFHDGRAFPCYGEKLAQQRDSPARRLAFGRLGLDLWMGCGQSLYDGDAASDSIYMVASPLCLSTIHRYKTGEEFKSIVADYLRMSVKRS